MNPHEFALRVFLAKAIAAVKESLATVEIPPMPPLDDALAKETMQDCARILADELRKGMTPLTRRWFSAFVTCVALEFEGVGEADRACGKET